MFKNFSLLDKSTQIENLTQQVLKVLGGKDSNPATIKFISQLQSGNIFKAVFVRNLPGGKGVLLLEGNKVIVELPKEFSFKGQNEQKDLTRTTLSKGQTIIVRVENSGSKAALKIISLPSHEDPLKNVGVTTNLTPRGKSISRFFGLKEFHQSSSSPNSITNARVTSILDSKSILIETGGKSFSVPVENVENFKPGSQVSIYFKKPEGGQHPVLMKSGQHPVLMENVQHPELIETGSNKIKRLDFNSLKPYLPARMPITKMANLLRSEILDSPVIPDLKIQSDVVVRLRDTLRVLLPSEGEIPSATQVRQQVASSGINYEAKVRQVLEFPSNIQARKELASDLKGLLLELYHSTEQVSAKVVQNAPGRFAEFRQTIKYAIDNIELNQLSSQISKQENQPLVIQIPNPLSSGNKTIQLFVRDDSSENETGNKNPKKNHHVAFFLDLSSLGKIKINAKMNQESLSVCIDVESEEIANFIRHRTNDFEEKMNENKINTSVECFVTHEVKPAKDNLIELLVSKNTSLINIQT